MIGECIMGILKQLFGRPDRSVTLAALQRDLDLINESAAIMEKTSNPETFFSRYDFSEVSSSAGRVLS